MFGLGREARAGTAALDVEDHQGELGHHRQPHELALQGDPRPAGAGESERAGVSRADGRADGGDFILGLKGFHSEPFVTRELMEHIARGGDRVAGVKQVAPGTHHRGHRAQRERLVSGHVPVAPGRELGLANPVVGGEHLGGVGVVVTRQERGAVGLQQHGGFAELGVDPGEGVVERAVEHPVDHAEREEVLAARGLLAIESCAEDRVQGERGEREFDQAVAREDPILERIVVIPGFLQAGLVEGVLVNDQDAALLQVGEIDLERGGIHRHQDIGAVAGSADVVVAEVELEAAHSRKRTGRGANLRREVRERAHIVPEDRAGVRELGAGELHAVAGVSGESDHRLVQFGGGDPSWGDNIKCAGGCWQLLSPSRSAVPRTRRWRDRGSQALRPHYAPSGDSIFCSSRGGRLNTSAGKCSAM
ncbi:MAG: hypothetical protein GHCLOJNM_01839 [bacterium]|nr:hypothetical protein [bacterium]